MAVYLLDSNFFIEAHRRLYPFDLWPSFWDAVRTLAEQGYLISIDKVRDEIFKNDDALKRWMEQKLPEDFFKLTETPDVLDRYVELVRWAESWSGHYQRAAIDEFLRYGNADTWMIAYAYANGVTTVSEEVRAPQKQVRIKVPDVCDAKGVRCLNRNEMFRELGVRF